MATFRIGKIPSIPFVKYAQISLRVMVTKICLCVYEAPLFLINPISHSIHSMAVVKYIVFVIVTYLVFQKHSIKHPHKFD